MPLACPSCRDLVSIAEIIGAAISSVPGDGLVDFRCPLCGEQGLARLADGLAETVRATEGGILKVVAFDVVSDLAVASRPRSLAIWYRGKQKKVPDREALIRLRRAPPGRPAA